MLDLRPASAPPEGSGGTIAGTGGLRWSPSWCLEGTAATGCVLSAGGDRRVAIDGLSAEMIGALVTWERSGAIEVTDATVVLVDRLVELGAIEPVVSTSRTIRLTSPSDGPVAEQLAEQLADHLGGHRLVVDDGGGAAAGALALVLRTGARWPDPPDGVHLGVDLTLDHTVVLGPLVVPGVTCCLACAAGRAAHRWGEVAVPPRPRIVERLAVVAALVVVQIELVEQRRSPLVNSTVAWDLELGTTDRQHVYKLPGCQRCDRGAVTGRVELPWARRDVSTWRG